MAVCVGMELPVDLVICNNCGIIVQLSDRRKRNTIPNYCHADSQWNFYFTNEWLDRFAWDEDHKRPPQLLQITRSTGNSVPVRRVPKVLL